MELFKNTNYDFLGMKWPFIGASLVLSVAGLISLAVHHGPKYGIDFRGGAELRLRFNSEPPVAKIRSALDASGIKGGKSVQQITGKPEVLIVTEITNEAELNANRALVESTLRGMFGDTAGKVDINNATADELAQQLQATLANAGVPLSSQQITDLAKAIENYRAST